MDLPPPVADPLAQPTRARIFAFLVEKRAPADTAELAAQFDLHPNGIRLHLERLEAGGLVVRGRARSGGGRPRDTWTVSPHAHPGGTSPRAYADLSAWLARTIPATLTRLREVECTGRRIGAELAPEHAVDPATGLRDALAALGFEPMLEHDENRFSCRLGNCPYRDSVRANQAVVCGLHRGITKGILEKLAPGAELTRFEPHDPERAGCLIEVAGAQG